MVPSRHALDTRHAKLRRRLGLGVLLLTIVAAYAASHQERPRTYSSTTIDSHITEAASRYAVSKELIVAVIDVESQFNTRAVSHRGAQGLMQLMPATAASLGVRDAFDPRDNIDGGVRHLRRLMDRFDDDVPTVLAAYNAGEGAVLRNHRVPRETREYVKRVMGRMSR